MRSAIYLDHAATTRVDPRVVEVMLPYWTEHYGNAESVHSFGRAAKRGLEGARESVARQLNASPKEILFTAGGSESDNMALRGVMMQAGQGSHLITSIVEHKAVLDTARQLRDLYGFELTILPVDQFGRIRLSDLEAAIRPNTALISIMAANNEIGTLQPVAEIGRIAQQHNVLFHTDAVQAIKTENWNMATQPIDLLSIAAHKFNGPKGVGILYIRDGVEIIPATTGGGQERGLRPGTHNVAFAVGVAKALELAQVERLDHIARDTALRNQMIAGTLDALGDLCVLTGHPAERLPFNASFAIRDLKGNDMLMHLDMEGVAASSGSACSVGNPKPSRILDALGLSDEWLSGGLRFTVGVGNTASDIDQAINALVKTVDKLRKLTLKYR
ncbi:MAG: cysteine desulfurase family protein [Candidatus Promineifilaceae bacterium]